jgi:hypothetical protein
VNLSSLMNFENYGIIYFHKTGMRLAFSCFSVRFICLPFGVPVFNCTGLSKVKLLIRVLYKLLKNMIVCS